MAVWFPAQGFLNLPEMFLSVLKSTETVTLKSGGLVYMSKCKGAANEYTLKL